MEIINIIIAGLVASFAWFIAGGILYMNPFSKRIYKSEEKNQGVRKWKNSNDMLISMYILETLIQSLIFAGTYYALKPALSGGLWINTLYFGLLIVAVKIIPRLIDMALMTTYPGKLLKLDLFNGTICSFIVAFVLSLLL
jgi:small-conductance mechanosensitive channel